MVIHLHNSNAIINFVNLEIVAQGFSIKLKRNNNDVTAETSQCVSDQLGGDITLFFKLWSGQKAFPLYLAAFN